MESGVHHGTVEAPLISHALCTSMHVTLPVQDMNMSVSPASAAVLRCLLAPFLSWIPQIGNITWQTEVDNLVVVQAVSWRCDLCQATSGSSWLCQQNALLGLAS